MVGKKDDVGKDERLGKETDAAGKKDDGLVKDHSRPAAEVATSSRTHNYVLMKANRSLFITKQWVLLGHLFDIFPPYFIGRIYNT